MVSDPDDSVFAKSYELEVRPSFEKMELARKESYRTFDAALWGMLNLAIYEKEFNGLHRQLLEKNVSSQTSLRPLEKMKLGLTVHDLHYLKCIGELREKAKSHGVEVLVRPVDPPSGTVDPTPELRIEFIY